MDFHSTCKEYEKNIFRTVTKTTDIRSRQVATYWKIEYNIDGSDFLRFLAKRDERVRDKTL